MHGLPAVLVAIKREATAKTKRLSPFVILPERAQLNTGTKAGTKR